MIKDKTYMEITKTFAKESKCIAKHVACLIVKDDNIISVGINGTPSGKTNCNEKFYKNDEGVLYERVKHRLVKCNKEAHHEWSLYNEFHAELNALSKANKNGLNVEGSTAYITHSPCFNCSKMLVAFGIKRIVFEQEYDDFNTGVSQFLLENDIEIVKI